MDNILRLVGALPFLNRTINRIKEFWNSDELKEYMQKALTILVYMVTGSLIALVLILSATMIYTILYYMIMPSRIYQQPLYFNYGPHSEVHEDYVQDVKRLPQTSLNFLTSHLQWESTNYTDGGLLYANRVLTPGTYYDVIIELEVPESNVNTEIGMFMVNTTLKSENDRILARSARPSIVKVTHWMPSTLSALFWTLPVALGLTDFTQKIKIMAFNGYWEENKYPLVSATIMMSHPKLQIYNGQILIITQLHGIRYLMYHWFFTTAILCILNIAWIEGLALIVLYTTHKMSQEDPMDPSADFVKPPRVPEGMVPLSPVNDESALDDHNMSYPFDDAMEEKEEMKEESTSSTSLRFRTSASTTLFSM